jgi:hypothetical protein
MFCNDLSLSDLSFSSDPEEITGFYLPQNSDTDFRVHLPLPIRPPFTPQDDTIHGSLHNDEIGGGDGHDSLHGHQGHDQLIGGSGNDELHGGDGMDYLRGDEEDDILRGGEGSDRLEGGTGNDRLYAEGAGRDELYGEGDSDYLTVTLKTSSDKFYADGGDECAGSSENQNIRDTLDITLPTGTRQHHIEDIGNNTFRLIADGLEVGRFTNIENLIINRQNEHQFPATFWRFFKYLGN